MWEMGRLVLEVDLSRGMSGMVIRMPRQWIGKGLNRKIGVSQGTNV